MALGLQIMEVLPSFHGAGSALGFHLSWTFLVACAGLLCLFLSYMNVRLVRHQWVSPEGMSRTMATPRGGSQDPSPLTQPGASTHRHQSSSRPNPRHWTPDWGQGWAESGWDSRFCKQLGRIQLQYQ